MDFRGGPLKHSISAYRGPPTEHDLADLPRRGRLRLSRATSLTSLGRASTGVTCTRVISRTPAAGSGPCSRLRHPKQKENRMTPIDHERRYVVATDEASLTHLAAKGTCAGRSPPRSRSTAAVARRRRRSRRWRAKGSPSASQPAQLPLIATPRGPPCCCGHSLPAQSWLSSPPTGSQRDTTRRAGEGCAAACGYTAGN